MIDATSLHEELETAALPVVGVSSDGRVDYSRDLTPEEQTTAAAVIAAHDPTKRERDELTARQQAKAHADGLQAYLDLASPTGVQTVAAVKAIIRVLLWLLRNEFRI
jgi:hypothetical protein